jgi:predicted ArsR family transcriptional regulator
MHSTKSEILAVLKRTDGSTVDDLASSLGLAPMTVRQHLTALARDALVGVEQVRSGAGRPHHVYRLTDEGHRSVADGSDRLLALLVDVAGTLDLSDGGGDADARRARLFRAGAQRLGERHAAEVRALRGEARIARIVTVLRAHGGFAEWHEGDGVFELRDFSCVFRSLVRRSGDCEWHTPLLQALLGEAVRTADGEADCAACCRYEIPVRDEARVR